MKKPVLLFFLLCVCGIIFAQGNDLLSFNEIRLEKQQMGMLVLGIWAAGNIATGALLVGRRKGEDHYFHLMNISWNAVNLGLATLGYLNAIYADPASFNPGATIQQQYNIEKILLLNTGLDLGYVVGGFYLIERSKSNHKNPERLRGFGKSIVLQGGFLLAFDLAFYLTHVQTRSGGWQELWSSVYFDGSQIGLALPF